jgi:hypothetical protein
MRLAIDTTRSRREQQESRLSRGFEEQGAGNPPLTGDLCERLGDPSIRSPVCWARAVLVQRLLVGR